MVDILIPDTMKIFFQETWQLFVVFAVVSRLFIYAVLASNNLLSGLESFKQLVFTEFWILGKIFASFIERTSEAFNE